MIEAHTLFGVAPDEVVRVLLHAVQQQHQAECEQIRTLQAENHQTTTQRE
jgi:hypothetical protein